MKNEDSAENKSSLPMIQTSPDDLPKMNEENFDIPFIADLALREKQIQQNYRPIIAVRKWFAGQPGLFWEFV